MYKRRHGWARKRTYDSVEHRKQSVCAEHKGDGDGGGEKERREVGRL